MLNTKAAMQVLIKPLPGPSNKQYKYHTRNKTADEVNTQEATLCLYLRKACQQKKLMGLHLIELLCML